ncbi:Gfo/Idh/MocA family protein [Mycolicibacterium sp.]|uniref:Gfo/Idh/MocA family protein n=1 Tax=Mycolicibacterium sp. TaxID=2320850 RepID=UPI003D1027DA
MSRARYLDGGIGVAVIGAGGIGRLRAEICHRHPAVNFLAVCDIRTDRVEALARDVEADLWSTDAATVINDERVDAVIVATTENAHFDPTMCALRAGRATLVEKPLTIEADEGETVVAEADSRGVRLFTGFTQRFRRRYLSVKEHVDAGYLGAITTAKASIYITQAVAHAVISRAGTTTPAINTMTYSIDLLLWFLEGRRPLSVYALGGRGRFYDEFGSLDSTWAVMDFGDGQIANVGVSWEPPEFWPAYVATMEVELFGRDGLLSVKDDHRDILLATNRGVPSPYTPDVAVNVAMLGSAMPGDWAQGEYYGAMKDETHAFLASATGDRVDPALATGRQGADVLKVCRAIDLSAQKREVVTLDWAQP